MFLPLRDPLVATFNETRAPTSRKYVAEDTKINPEQFKPDELFWYHSSVFAVEF